MTNSSSSIILWHATRETAELPIGILSVASLQKKDFCSFYYPHACCHRRCSCDIQNMHVPCPLDTSKFPLPLKCQGKGSVDMLENLKCYKSCNSSRNSPVTSQQVRSVLDLTKIGHHYCWYFRAKYSLLSLALHNAEFNYNKLLWTNLTTEGAVPAAI